MFNNLPEYFVPLINSLTSADIASKIDSLHGWKKIITNPAIIEPFNLDIAKMLYTDNINDFILSGAIFLFCLVIAIISINSIINHKGYDDYIDGKTMIALIFIILSVFSLSITFINFFHIYIDPANKLLTEYLMYIYK